MANHASYGREWTHSIGIPASLIFLAVPPDPNILTPASFKPLASSRRSDLSYTDKRALTRILNARLQEYQSRTHRWASTSRSRVWDQKMKDGDEQGASA